VIVGIRCSQTGILPGVGQQVLATTALPSEVHHQACRTQLYCVLNTCDSDVLNTCDSETAVSMQHGFVLPGCAGWFGQGHPTLLYGLVTLPKTACLVAGVAGPRGCEVPSSATNGRHERHACSRALTAWSTAASLLPTAAACHSN